MEYIEDRQLRAECKFCDKTFAADATVNGSKNVKLHYEKCDKNPANEDSGKGKGKQTQLVFEPAIGDEGDKLKNWVFDFNEVREALTHMIIVDVLPFRFVEKPGFQNLMHVMNPRFHRPSRFTIGRDCYEIYLKEKVYLKELIAKSCQRISITTDTWTSIRTVNFMCVTAHFIDHEWKLQKRILNFCPIGSHKGEDIGKAVEVCLEYWGVDDRLFTVTVDNASSNDVACGYLRKMIQRSVSGCISNGKYVHLRCIAHIVNLIAWDGMGVHVKCIDRVRSAVKHVKNSATRLARFNETAEKLKIGSKASLSLDVPTRWNSTYIMLDTAIKFRRVFGYVKLPDGPDVKDSEKPPIDSDWDKISLLVSFLKELYRLTCRISGTLYVTSNKGFFEIASTHNLLRQWERSNDSEFQSMAKAMKAKYDKYWGDVNKMNLYIYMAALLDPQCKLFGVDIALKDMYEQRVAQDIAEKVKDFAYDMFDEYRQLYSSQTGQNSDTLTTQHVRDDDGEETSLDYFRALQDKVKRLKGTASGTRTEFERYLNEQTGEDEGKDVLLWWKLNEPRFPVVARMARDILAMPLSTVASESAFSAGGRHLDRFRSSLSPKVNV
uniref:Transposase n=1 Tax=Kalanchoe fedtschenkoi TaxID=63787 RepID=A0A7N0TNC7_KALFE